MGPNQNFIKQFDYGTSEHLWMSIFMQKIRKNEWTVLQVLCESRFVDVNVKCFKIKMHNLDQIRIF